MAAKVRKQMYLGVEQERRVKRIAEGAGVSEAEVIRKAIDQYILSASPIGRDTSAWQAEQAYLIDLAAQGAVEPGTAWQREELHDR